MKFRFLLSFCFKTHSTQCLVEKKKRTCFIDFRFGQSHILLQPFLTFSGLLKKKKKEIFIASFYFFEYKLEFEFVNL